MHNICTSYVESTLFQKLEWRKKVKKKGEIWFMLIAVISVLMTTDIIYFYNIDFDENFIKYE